jgi:CheY-like chemotaxis protein
VRTVSVSLLEQLGYRTTAVESAPVALEKLAAGAAFDLIFTDVVLPGDVDGLALARTVKSRYPGIPIVLTTGYAKIFDTEPEFPVLRKPYQLAALGRARFGEVASGRVGRSLNFNEIGTTRMSRDARSMSAIEGRSEVKYSPRVFRMLARLRHRTSRLGRAMVAPLRSIAADLS